MSCNGCRVLRRGCSENCILRPCLEWIDTPKAQANATLFVSKFFGRSDLLAFISAVPENKRPALFQSLLYEACGRTVNPVNGAIGLLSTGNWHLCQEAVEKVLSGGELRPIMTGILTPVCDESSAAFGDKTSTTIQSQYCSFAESNSSNPFSFMHVSSLDECLKQPTSPSLFLSEVVSDVSTSSGRGRGSYNGVKRVGGEEPKLLNLFV